MIDIRQFSAGAIAALALAAASPALAQGRFAVGANLGTSGGGGELAYQISPKFVIRGDYDYLKYSGEIHGEVLTYTGDLNLQTGGLFVDFHPTASPWLISGGAYIGARSAEGDPTLSDINRIGNDSFLREQIGVIHGKLTLDEFAPYLGVGWNNTFYNEHWGFKAMAGLAFSNQPKIELTRTGGAELPPAIAERLKTALGIESDTLSRDSDILKTYPIFQVGLTYRF